MKHFIESRKDVLLALADAQASRLAEKICVIFDLKGMCRVLVRTHPNADLAKVKADFESRFSGAAEMFWGGEVWIEAVGTSASRAAVYGSVWRQAQPFPIGQDQTFMLDRRLSKDSWFGAPVQPPWPFLPGNAPPILSFYSSKGGVGRTTALASVAINLARIGKKVAIIDFDLESPGIGPLFSPPPPNPFPYGVVDYILEKSASPGTNLQISDYSYVYHDRAIVDTGEIFVVPAGEVDLDYLEKLARINYDHLYRTEAEPNARPTPLKDLFRSLRSHYDPDFVLIDSRSGFHDLGGLSLSGLSHWHVLFGVESRQSWNGIEVAVKHIGHQEILADRKQRDCTLVHAMAPATAIAGKEEAVRRFKQRSHEVFARSYYDAFDSTGGEWPVPDLEAVESPHFPVLLPWNERVLGYREIGDIFDELVGSEYRSLTTALLERLGLGGL